MSVNSESVYEAPERIKEGYDSISEETSHGEFGVWLFVLGDMIIFATLFILYALDYVQDRATFISGQAHLNDIFGVINTLLLLTGSLCIVIAVKRARNNVSQNIGKYILATISTGFVFIANKFIEYSKEIAQGHTLVTDDFFMYYYTLTAIHLLHVLIGIGVLIFLYWKVSSQGLRGENSTHLESGGLIWHMVDLLWIAIFPLLYLI